MTEASDSGSPATTGGGNITISSGASEQQIGLNPNETLTVGDIRERLGLVLNIAPTAIAVIGEDEVDDDQELSAGQTLQFIKRSGSKG